MDKYTKASLLPSKLNEYIYIPYENSYNLWRFDTRSECYKMINLRDYIPHRFKGSTICLISRDSLYIFTKLNSFILNTRTLSCRSLPHTINTRTGPALLYYKNRVYVIGGLIGPRACKIADYLDLNTNKWIQLPRLQYSRSYSSCVGVCNQVIVIGSWTESCIEIYNTETDRKYTTSINIPIYGNIATLCNNSIYIFTNSEVIVMNYKLEIINTSSCRPKNKVTHSNIIIYYNSMYVVNLWYYNIQIYKFPSLSCSSIQIPEILFS
jgi:hypothetical protein